MLIRILLPFLLGWISALSANATSVLPLSLDQIIRNAAIAFQGNCISNRTEADAQSGLMVTYTSFRIQEVLKGQVGSTYTVKQVGGKISPNGTRLQAREIDGAPQFEVGQNYVVFMYGVSPAGFSSPVGLNQGNFRVLQDAQGMQVTNGRDFKEMTTDPAASFLPSSTRNKLGRTQGRVDRLDLDEFKQLVRQQIGEVK